MSNLPDWGTDRPCSSDTPVLPGIETAMIPEYIELCPKCLRLLVDCSDPDKHCSACGYCGQDSIYYVRQMGKLPDA